MNAFQTFHLHPAGAEVRVCAMPLPSRTVQLRFHTQPHAYFTAICSPPPRIIKGSTAFDRRNKACRPAGVAATCLQRHRRGWRSLRFASARARARGARIAIYSLMMHGSSQTLVHNARELLQSDNAVCSGWKLSETIKTAVREEGVCVCVSVKVQFSCHALRDFAFIVPFKYSSC